MFKIIIITALTGIFTFPLYGQSDTIDFARPVIWKYSQVNMSGYGWESNTGQIETTGSTIVWTQPSGMVYEWEVTDRTESWDTTGEVTFHITGQTGYLSMHKTPGHSITGKLYLQGKDGGEDIFEFKIEGQPELQ